MGDLLNIGATATEFYRQALSTVSNNIGYTKGDILCDIFNLLKTINWKNKTPITVIIFLIMILFTELLCLLV